MALLGNLLAGKIRSEMKERVEQILKAGNEWNQTANKLIESLNSLTAAIQQGKVDPISLNSVVAVGKSLSKNTARLAKSFQAYDRTLNRLVEKLG